MKPNRQKGTVLQFSNAHKAHNNGSHRNISPSQVSSENSKQSKPSSNIKESLDRVLDKADQLDW